MVWLPTGADPYASAVRSEYIALGDILVWFCNGATGDHDAKGDWIVYRPSCLVSNCSGREYELR
jgi:hypothetical protein